MEDEINNIINKDYGSDRGQFYRKKESIKIDNLLNDFTDKIPMINEKEKINDIRVMDEKIDDLSQ